MASRERDLSVAGGRELDRLLNTLPANIHANILRSALSAGAAVYREQAREEVPVSSGRLKKSIRVSSRVQGRKGLVTASVKAGSKKTPYAVLVEFGTRPHQIKAPPGRALRFRNVTVVEVEHPGSKGRPFMRPAAGKAFAKAVGAVKSKIRERLTEQGIRTPGPLMDDPEE